jgi:molybdenum cofactor biosynthesis protein B
LQKRILDSGHLILKREIVKDEFQKISELFLNLINDKKIDVIISTGGTGLTGRDITPEVMKTLFEKTIDGFGEMFRWMSYKKIGTSAFNQER